LSLVVAYGLVTWHEILPRILSRVPTFGFMVGMGLGAVGFPLLLITPAYTPAPALDTLPNGVNEVDVRFGSIEMLGYTVDDEPATDELRVSVYWRAQEVTERPLSLYIQVFGPNDNYEAVEVGKVDSYPSGGLRRTDTWETGVIYAETYRIKLDNESGSFQPRLKFGWRNNETDEEVPPTTMAGDPLESVVVRGGRVVQSRCERDDALVRFGGLAELVGYDISTTTVEPGGTFNLTLNWYTLSETDLQQSIFVQLVDDTGRQVGSGDSAPRQDWYPTDTWVSEVCFTDVHHVIVSENAEPGTYALQVGIYNPDTGVRLPASGDLPDSYRLEIPITVE
jgi:hypothetical protein